MAEKLEIYECKDCGDIIEVLRSGSGRMDCCGKPMAKLVANTVDAAKEKHVPVIEKLSDGFKVKIGSIPHPMEEKHYIEWIELLADGIAYRRFLKPGDAPEAVFNVKAAAVSAREHCNIHGLWEGK
jgi:superoxide reductase